ncbi:hypothetical protein KCV07_g7858, partial [Aureobasidium melanogenum]
MTTTIISVPFNLFIATGPPGRARSYATTSKASPREAFGGGVKRISATIYEEVRYALKDRLGTLLEEICVLHVKPSLMLFSFSTGTVPQSRKTITAPIVVLIHNRHGTPISASRFIEFLAILFNIQ